jgi:Uma2 family endonuclease
VAGTIVTYDAVMATVTPKLPLTYADLEQFPDDGNRYELIEGSLHVTPSPNWRHQSVVSALLVLLATALPTDRKVFPAPLDVIFSDDTVLEPDVLVVPRTSLGRRVVEGSIDLAVEILSSSTRRYDQVLKRSVYAQYRVPRYWIVDPDEPSLLVFALDAATGEYAEHARVVGAEPYANDTYGVIVVPSALVE